MPNSYKRRESTYQEICFTPLQIPLNVTTTTFSSVFLFYRSLEIKQIRLASTVRAINSSVSMFLNRTALYVAVLAYTLAGNAPQAYYVFVVTSFYNVLKQPLVFHIPQAISSLSESAVSIKRIQGFLLAEEIEAVPDTVKYDAKTIGVFFQGVSTKWNSSGEDSLSGVSLSARKNELIAIVGPVGKYN